MRRVKDLIKDEPIALYGIVAALANLIIALGLNIDGDVISGINIFIGATFGLLRWLVFSPGSVEEAVSITKHMTHEKLLSDLETLAEAEREKRRAKRLAKK